nr:hypothetical protein [Tanacetum cinerariifolium]
MVNGRSYVKMVSGEKPKNTEQKKEMRSMIIEKKELTGLTEVSSTILVEKLSKMGRKFGFVRFIRVKNTKEVENVSVKYGESKGGRVRSQQHGMVNGRSYAKMVSGEKRKNMEQKKEMQSMIIEKKELTGLTEVSSTILAEVRYICVKNDVNFIGLQETRMTKVDLVKIRSMCGNNNFDFACCTAEGRSGTPLDMNCTMINVYAPQDINQKRVLWNHLASIVTGTSAEDFNGFIDDNELIDVPMGGKKFTKEERYDYGPYSFKIFNSWIEMEGFHELMRSDQMMQRKMLDSRLGEIDRMIDDGHGSNDIMSERRALLQKLLADRLVKVVDSLVSPEQSAFIKGRQIIDSVLMVNEIVTWAKKHKKKMMMFKVDFEKAYDSLSWDYLDCMFDNMGFGDKWRMWIRGCLVSARSSVLLNGSPNKEFHIHRGLRQGDPLSPFLFILAMEGLHIAIDDAVQNSQFRGVTVGILPIHMCTGCGADSLPFVYLGLPVGERMYRINSLMLIGGRLTLAKSVLGSIGIYHLSLFPLPVHVNKHLESIKARFLGALMTTRRKSSGLKRDVILNSKEKGGLDVGSLWALNQALIFKWNKNSKKWCMAGIGKASMELHKCDFIPNLAIRRKIGNGMNTRFWKDVWCGDRTLEDRFPRMASLASDRNASAWTLPANTCIGSAFGLIHQ